MANFQAIPVLLLCITLVKGSILPRIIGGQETNPHEFPWMVSIYARQYQETFCSATIVNQDWLLTWPGCSQYAPVNYFVIAGEHNIHTDEGVEQYRRVSEIVNHPDYSGWPPEAAISLMKLVTPLNFNRYVQPALIAESNFTLTGEATMIGWGAVACSQGSCVPSPTLRKVNVTRTAKQDCEDLHGIELPDSTVCYGGKGKGDCGTWDWGGPIMCGENKTVCAVMGIGDLCGDTDQLPSQNTEVPRYREWIRNVTGT